MPARQRHFNERSAGGLVVRESPSGHEVLLIRVGNAWSLPKGNLDPGESPDRTALREIAEETGLPVANLRVTAELPPSEYVYRRRDSGRLVFKRVDHYLVKLLGDAPVRPQAEEVDEVAWVPLAEAERRVSYRDLRAALAEAKKLLSADGAGAGT